MEWILSNPKIQSAFGSLGHVRDGTYQINDDCDPTLDAIYRKLLSDDATSCMFRKAIGLGQNIKNDLIPLLMFTNNRNILDKTVKILVNLTMPVECLLPLDTIAQSHSGRHTLFELNNLLYSAKESFANNNSTKAILGLIKSTVDKCDNISSVDCGTINNCILLLRNILHIPEKSVPKKPRVTNQNQILWNLFSTGMDKILISLMTSEEAAYWSVAIVQLMALLYKDQPFIVLQKLLNQSLDSLSESSDDNESNTSPPNTGSDGHVTSEMNSDSSDGCGAPIGDTKIRMTGKDVQSQKRAGANDADENVTKPKKCKNDEPEDSMFEMSTTDDKASSLSSTTAQTRSSKVKKTKIEKSVSSDLGYGTQIEAQESPSTSSNDDEVQQAKPTHKPQRAVTKCRISLIPGEKKEIRRKKIIKRGKCSKISVKGLLNHNPTDEDIAYVLKEFIVDFLLKGYNPLVKNLHRQLISNLEIQIDTSHFFWLVTYFLKFASHLEIDLEHISYVLSYDVLSYITSEGVNLCEQLEIFKQSGCDLTPCIRRMHLVVTAVKESLQTIDAYKKFTHLSIKEEEYLKHVEFNICLTKELRCLFVLLLRLYNPELHAKQYLQDLIVTNHMLLLCLDNGNADMMEHLTQFATVPIVGHYGILLEDYRNNGEMVNDCIFTMLHHISGDLNCISMLFQPTILKAFYAMRKTEYELCEEWIDLIDWTLNISTKNPSSVASYYYVVQNAKHSPEESLASVKAASSEEADDEKWQQEDAQLLNWYYTRSLQCEDIIQNIVNLYGENDLAKSKKSVIKQLHYQDIIDNDEYDALIHKEDLLCNDIALINNSADEVNSDISALCEKLKLNNVSFAWVQAVLLEACYAKTLMPTKAEDSLNPHFLEPVSFYNIYVNQSIPIVPWNNDQESSCANPVFSQLMRCIGLYTPTETGKIFYRIPNVWTPAFMFAAALKLGTSTLTNFYRLNDRLGLRKIETIRTVVDAETLANKNVNKSPLPTADNKTANVESDKPQKEDFKEVESLLREVTSSENTSNCVGLLDKCSFATASVASDLAHMFVSDEEEMGDD